MTEQYDSINEFVVAGEFGFKRIEGPFEVVKDGTIWEIVVPDDSHPSVPTLSNDEGESAVLIADGKAVGGGVVDHVESVERHDEIHVLVDQYARGGTE